MPTVTVLCAATGTLLSTAGCGGDVACIDADSIPRFCYQAASCYEGDEVNAADEEHADATCAELGFTVDCGNGDFYDLWAESSCLRQCQ